MTSGVQLLAYADRFGGEGLRGLRDLLKGPLEGLFSGVHVLPFYYPIDGADAGFDPIDHLAVDGRVGGWDDVQALADVVNVTADLIVNHISSESAQFLDYLHRGGASPYAGMFLTAEKVFQSGMTEDDIGKIYRPRPTSPFVVRMLGDGDEQRLWTTFTPKQIDIDVADAVAQSYLNDILVKLAASGVTTVRLDAVGYAVKTPGTSCFMTEETYRFIDTIADWTRQLGMRALGEIHSHYRYQLEAAKHVDYVYDFALPPLILHTLFEHNTAAIKEWFNICPRNAITVLDTHDGIGVMDVGPDALDESAAGLLAPEYIESMVNTIHKNSAGVSKQASQQDVGNLDLYQVNCAYYDAVGRDDRDYLLARLIQFFAPGTPQVYYVGLLAGENDTEQLSRTRWGRDVNRRFYSRDDINKQLDRPVVKSLLGLIRFRNRCRAFDGTFELLESSDHELRIRRQLDDEVAALRVDIVSRKFEVTYSKGSSQQQFADFGSFSAQ